MIALQIDLARQKEKIDYVKSYVDMAKKYGYNTVFLYLETCVRTEDTPHFDETETFGTAGLAISYKTDASHVSVSRESCFEFIC